MKKIVFLLITMVSLSFIQLDKSELTQQQRKFAIDYFTKTKERLLADVKGLSDAQLNYKPDSSRWSVAQCVEHIALSENGLWQWCMLSLKNDTSALKGPEKKITDEQLIAGVTDRTNKRTAPEMLQPKNTFSNEAGSLAAFVSRRDSTLQYLKTTKDNLTGKYMQTPAGTLDIYQGLLLLAAHTARHTAQLEEVLKSPGFPKK